MSNADLQIDNRGDRNVPFGFVYVGQTRVGFDSERVWPTYNWPSSEEDGRKAAQALKEEFGYNWEVDEQGNWS